MAAGIGALVLFLFVVSAYFLNPATSIALALGAGLLAVAAGVWSWGARLAWRHASFAGGLCCAAIATGSRIQDEPWSDGGPGYMQEIDRAMGPLNNLVWELAARGGLAILVLAALLFALTYWLLGPSRRKA